MSDDRFWVHTEDAHGTRPGQHVTRIRGRALGQLNLRDGVRDQPAKQQDVDCGKFAEA